MKTRQISLDDTELMKLLDIIRDKNYWKSLRVKRIGAESDVSSIQRLLPNNANLKDFDLVNRLKAKAEERLAKGDPNRPQPTIDLLVLLKNLESPNAKDVFKQVEVAYLAFKIFEDSGLKKKSLQGEHVKSEYDKSAMTDLSIATPQQKIMSQCEQPIKLKSDFSKTKLSRNEFEQAVTEELKTTFFTKYPNVVQSYNDYIAKVYTQDRKAFLNDLELAGGGHNNALNLVKYMITHPLRIAGVTKDGKPVGVKVDSHKDIISRCQSVMNAMFSQQFRDQCVPSLNLLTEFIHQIRSIDNSRAVAQEQQNGRPFSADLLECVKTALVNSGLLIGLIKTQEQANEFERVLPGAISAVNRAEKAKNFQVTELSRRRHQPGFFNMPVGVLKMIVERTAIIPEPVREPAADKEDNHPAPKKR